MLTKRLDAVCGLVPYGIRAAADIGCDHGYLARELIIRKGAGRVIATDISEPSLEKARRLAERHNIADRMPARVGFGLRPVAAGEADLAVIAGMGGGEIISILSDPERRDGINNFILLPHKDAERLRRYLMTRYLIARDMTVADRGKFYDLMELSPGVTVLSEREIMFGHSDLKAPSADFINRLRSELRRAEEYGARASGERAEYFAGRARTIKDILQL
ncbi:MAG: class I SAM-dependent methyltransferase [Clostridiales bacterium]|jgi:tRNA (adenine22-N1)-methyltransferase|nr:class I SAM-dependent methyltransferase [Clostridiales bacterium]